MNKEDYFKYYIQGSDHYLIPRDIFEELFGEMSNWRDESKQLKEVIEEVREYIKDEDWLENTGEIKYLDKHNLCSIKVLHNKVEDINKILDKAKCSDD